MAFSISPGSGNRPSCFLEKTSEPSTVTSKTPPLEGINWSDAILFLYFLRSCSANLAAFSSYPQALQNSIEIFIRSAIFLPPRGLGLMLS